jgi:hypothetical protein
MVLRKLWVKFRALLCGGSLFKKPLDKPVKIKYKK